MCVVLCVVASYFSQGAAILRSMNVQREKFSSALNKTMSTLSTIGACVDDHDAAPPHRHTHVHFECVYIQHHQFLTETRIPHDALSTIVCILVYVLFFDVRCRAQPKSSQGYRSSSSRRSIFGLWPHARNSHRSWAPRLFCIVEVLLCVCGQSKSHLLDPYCSDIHVCVCVCVSEHVIVDGMHP